MALWMARAGWRGEYEKNFLEDSRIYLPWEGLSYDLRRIQSKSRLSDLLAKVYPNAGRGRIWSNTGQIWFFCKKMSPGDWVVLPSESRATIHVGEIKGEYVFAPEAEDPFRHYRDVEWIAEDISRSSFPPDLLQSFTANLTVCPISRNLAERRLRQMGAEGWRAPAGEEPPASTVGSPAPSTGAVPVEAQDPARVAREQVAEAIGQRFGGENLEWLVDAVLKAQGYVTFRGSEGREKGVDILAGAGSMGFDEPRLCVQVKPGEAPQGEAVLHQLASVMENLGADQGLLVSWGGFQEHLDREAEKQFFKIRLWGREQILDQVLANYERLEEDIQTALPLKRVWVLSQSQE